MDLPKMMFKPVAMVTLAGVYGSAARSVEAVLQNGVRDRVSGVWKFAADETLPASPKVPDT
jgi:hypothetical protein